MILDLQPLAPKPLRALDIARLGAFVAPTKQHDDLFLVLTKINSQTRDPGRR
jgi:hypothetical protein